MQNDDGNKTPDFLIVGAMKSGTTSLYSILKRHPQVFMPALEVGFFDIDDIRQHADFFKFRRGEWYYHPYSQRKTELQHWYKSLFSEADSGQVLGERSTVYMASEIVPGRIRSMIPDAKMIFMMRDPVPRAYSNYWHLLRSGEATSSFEKTLRYRTSVLFERGLYRPQVERYLDAFPREQLLFITFEEFVSDPERQLAKVCEFIGVEQSHLPDRSDKRHKNRGRYPWSKSLQYFVNSALFHGALDGHRFLDSHLPALQSDAMGVGPVARVARKGTELTFKVISRLNCSRRERPKMKPATKSLLKYLYEDRNKGLSTLIEKDLSNYWTVTKV